MLPEETEDAAAALEHVQAVIGEFRRSLVLVPIRDGGILTAEQAGLRWVFAFTDTALTEFAQARGEGGEWEFRRVYGARLLDETLAEIGVPCGIAVDVGSEGAFVLPPAKGIVPDHVAVVAGHPARPRLRRLAAELGHQRLPRRLRQPAAARRPARRPPRPQADVSRRDRRLHRRLAAGRARHRPRRPAGSPLPAGCRQRHGDRCRARHPRHALPGPAREPRCVGLRGRRGRGRGLRADNRAGRRRGPRTLRHGRRLHHPQEEERFLAEAVQEQRAVIRLRVSRLYGTALDVEGAD